MNHTNKGVSTAAKLFLKLGEANSTILQLRLNIGYERACRIMDQLELAGIVGPFNKTKRQEVLVHTEKELKDLLDNI